MPSKPTILIVNDDGVDSPFLPPMVEKLSALGRVLMAVPMTEQSWKGKSMTRFGEVPLARREEFGVEAYALGGTPSDCVNIAIHHLFPNQVDWVVSGINIGTNAGLAYLVNSGTVGAAVEGALQGLPTVAFSSYMPPPLFNQWIAEKQLAGEEAATLVGSTTSRMAGMMANLLDQGLPEKVTTLNINFPGAVTPQTPVHWTPLQSNRYGSLFKKTRAASDSPGNNGNGDAFTHSHMGQLEVTGPGESDMELLDRGMITVTALRLAGLSHDPPQKPRL